jgi:magnesium chelatase subunit D
VLLDVAVSGVNRVEREGISHVHPARFVLVASMNPEEGELRPQLLDRFGLAVDVVAPTDASMRVLAVQAQLSVERDPGAPAEYEAADAEVRRRLAAVGRASLPDDVIRRAADVALAVGAEGLRADLMLCRAAAANASWNGHPATTVDDLRTVAPLVLAHRRRRAPFDEPGIADDELDHAFATDPGAASPETRTETNDPDPASGSPTLPKARSASNRDGRRDANSSPTGRHVRDVLAGDAPATIAAAPTAINVATRRAVDPGAAPSRSDLREAVRERRRGNLVIVTVDTSGSMGAARRIELAKGVVLELLTHAYQQRDRVALVTFQGDRAEVVLRPTGSIEIARTRLVTLPTGGATPLAAGLAAARTLVRTALDQALEPIVVVVTDGRATSGGDDPLAAARAEAALLARDGVRAVVVDAEVGAARLGLAREIATALRCDCVSLDSFDAQRVAEFARSTRT